MERDTLTNQIMCISYTLPMCCSYMCVEESWSFENPGAKKKWVVIVLS